MKSILAAMGAALRGPWIALTVLSCSSCASQERPASAAPHEASAPPVVTQAEADAQGPQQSQAAEPAKETKAAEPPLDRIEITAEAQPEAPYPMPRVTIFTPRQDQEIAESKAAAFEVKLRVRHWPVREGGPHVHLILDNEPYLALYKPTATVRLGEIVPGAHLGEGQHLLVAFPSTANHISIKPARGRRPAAVVSFWIGKRQRPSFRPTDPILVYSRPKGEYVGPDAEAILLDYYLLNVPLGPRAYSVHPTVTPSIGSPRSVTLTMWQPLRILHLPDGHASVRLELRDKDGKIARGPWSVAERGIVVRDGGSSTRANGP